MDKPFSKKRTVTTMGSFATVPHALPATRGKSRDGHELAAGTAIEHFQVIRLLGRGGMGEVYLARDTKLGRKVAIKLVHHSLLSSRNAAANFLHEARATARFNHPHIVTIHATGEVDGRPFVALEYLEGENLRWRLLDGPLALGEVLRIGLAIAEALAEAHRHGVLHRDLKPDNVVMPLDGRLRVVDFGLARIVAQPGDVTASAAGSGASTAVGTPGYMAPETWLSQPSTAAVDTWAFGALLFELLSGELPYLVNAQPLKKVRAAVTGPNPTRRLSSLIQVPVTVDQLIAQCLTKKASERPTAEALVTTLRALLRGDTDIKPEQESPFRGLLPFSERHARHYFGRGAEVASFVELARTHPILPVVGPSGAGKTSFALAGVVPRLREQGYGRVVVVRPGAAPFRALAARLTGPEQTTEGPVTSASPPDPTQIDEIDALAARLADTPRALSQELRRLAKQTDTRVLLVVDQLEELFTLTSDAQVQRHFMEALCTAADDWSDPMRIIFTVRDDYLGRIATGQAVRMALSSVTVLRAPDAETLVTVLERTLESVGYSFEDETLARDMVAEVSGEATSLPLLQFAARQLWERRDQQDKTLLRSTYVDMGGVAGALATQADGVLEGLAPQQLLAAKRILLRLVTPQRTRRVRPREEALVGLAPDVAEEVLGRLVSGRLVSVRKMRAGAVGTLLELAHESLIINWTTLSRWVLDSREDLAMLAEVEQGADRWDKRGRRDAELWQGDALHDATRLLKRAIVQPSVRVRQFLESGEKLTLRRRRRRRLLLVAALVTLTGIILVLFWQRREATYQRDKAVAQGKQTEVKRAESLRESARAALGDRRLLEARAKVRSSLEIDDSVIVRGLWWQLEREALQWQLRFDTIIYNVSFSPDGRYALAGGQNRLVYLVDIETKELTPLRAHQDQVSQVAFFPQGDRMVSGSWDGEIVFWNFKDKSVQHRFKTTPRTVQNLTVTPDGKTLLAAGIDGHVRLWSTSSYKQIGELIHGDGSVRIAVSHDGQFVASAGGDGQVVLWRLADGSRMHVWKAHTRPITSVAFNPGGDRIVTGSDDLSARVWEVAGGKQLYELTGHHGTVRAAAFSRDGATLVTASRNGGLRVHNAETGALLRTFDYQDGSIHLAYHPDGDRVMVTGLGQLMLWRVGHDGSRQRRAHRKGIYGVAVSPDGKTVATGSYDHDVMLWDTKSGTPLRRLVGHRDTVHTIAYSSDGKLLYSCAGDGNVLAWDVELNTVRRAFRSSNAVLYALAVSPDGSRVAAGGDDRKVYVWDAESGLLLHELPVRGGRVHGLSFSADGNTLASASLTTDVSLWNVNTGTLLRTLESDPFSSMYSVAMAADTVYGAAGSTLWAWDKKTWTARVIASNHSARFYHVVPYPEDDRIVSAASSGLASVWSSSRGENIIDLRGHVDELNSVALDRAGKVLATAGDDGTVRLWDGDNYRPLWRAPALLRNPVRLLTHRGWTRLTSAAAPPSHAMDAAIATQARYVSQSEDASITCTLDHDGRVTVWQGDNNRASHSFSGVGERRLLAVNDGCLAADDRALYKLEITGDVRETPLPGVVSLANARVDDALGVLAVMSDSVLLLDDNGVEKRRWKTQPGVTAAAHIGKRMLIGYRDGHLHMLSDSDEVDRPFLGTPASPVVNILAGPGGTVIAGYANGYIGVWEPQTGTRLGHDRLHGAIAHLLLHDRTLYVASALGQHLSWNLSAFDRPYCELMNEVWRNVAVVWQRGEAKAVMPDAEHPCRRGMLAP